MRLLLAAAVMAIGLASPLRSETSGDTATLGRGINLGNFLEAPEEGRWSGGRLLQEDDFSNIKQAGFAFVRVPISWAAHAGPAPDYAIEPAFLARVDWVVAQAEKNGLTAILDDHNDGDLMKDPDAHGDRFVALWKQVGGHFKDAPPSILFELLNEPNGKLDAPKWNALLLRALAVVRADNPTRTVVVGPVHWNDIGALKDLVLPEGDPHLLVTVHFYDPFHFTHQGAEWAEGSTAWLGTTWGSDADRKAVSDSFDRAAKWGADHKRPMYLGEFGAYHKSPLETRAQWTACVARTAEAHGMAWSYWEYCSGFGAYDPQAKQWRKPLLEALLPPS
jgi:endoglucanase